MRCKQIWVGCLSVLSTTIASFVASAVEVPEDFQELNWIESSDGAYIDTLYTHTAKTKIECRIDGVHWQSGRYPAIFGSRNGKTGGNAFAFCTRTGTYQRFSASFHRETASTYREVRSNYGASPLICEGNHAFWRSTAGGQYSFDLDVTPQDGVNTLFIFDANNGGPGEKLAGQWPANVRLYWFKIYEGDDLIRDFVPVMHKSTGAIGLFDKVAGVYYGTPDPVKGFFKRSGFGWCPYRELDSGVYTFNDNILYGAPMCESAIKIKPGATVTLYIPAGVTVTLWGGDADREKGAGAGIEVPADATLKLAGEGTLYVHGGNGSIGLDGTNGGTGRVVLNDPDQGGKHWYYSGSGGDGAQGGGGAGAGIGGRGGNGGGGGKGGGYTDCEASREQRDGNPGRPGTPGEPGGDCGTIIVMNTLKLYANGGVAGRGGYGGEGGEWGVYDWSNWYVGYGGGGGGGGAGGMRGYDVGGGGGGGGGGAGGGSGSCAWFGAGRSEAATRHTGFGAGGLGGLGGKNGENGKNKHGTWASIRSDKESFERGSRYDSGQPVGAASGAAGAEGAWGQKGTKIDWQPYTYSDEKGEDRLLTKPYEVIAESTTKLKDGWNVLTNSLELASLSIDGDVTANLLLMDGATLTLTNSFEFWGATTLNIFVQSRGTGALKVGGFLGSGWPNWGNGADYFNIYGGNLTVKGTVCCGGDGNPGVNGGKGGNVTLVRGAVDFGANVACGGNGGTSDDAVGAGGDGGTFSVSNGFVKIAGLICAPGQRGFANERGNTNKDGQPGKVTLTDGYYDFRPEPGWCDEPRHTAVLTNSQLKDEYPWHVMEGREVTIGETPNMTAVWTRGDSALTNAITGTTFTVPYRCTDLKVIFTPDPCYDLDFSTIRITGPIDYAYTIDPSRLPTATKMRAKVTIGFDLTRMSVAWTDGVTTNRVEDGSFVVPFGTDVSLVFLPDEGCRIVGEPTVSIGTVNADRTIEQSESIPKSVVDLPEEYDFVEYVESTRGDKQYIDTLYHPTPKTRLTADFRPYEKSEDWAVFFGVTSSDSSKDGVLLRYMDKESPRTVNGWFCNENYDEAKSKNIAAERQTVVLRADGMTIGNRETAITTTGTPYDGSIYLFCGNNGGKAWRHQAMQLFMFMIEEEIDGEMQIVRLFVPCRRKADRAGGLFELVEKKFYPNNGSGRLKYDTARFATITVPAVEHATHRFSTDDPWMEPAKTNETQVVYTIDQDGFSAKVQFVADEDYRITANGEKSWLVAGDVVFGTTEGFDLPTVEPVHGMSKDPWKFGESGVVAYTNVYGVLTIDGTGAMPDFASATAMPWNPAEIVAVEIGDEVTRIGKYAFDGLDDEVIVEGLPLSVYKKTASAYGTTIPEDQVLVSREALQAAKAETISIANGEVKLGVSVRTCADITAPVAEWEKTAETVLTIPVSSRQGFMILQSSDAKIK